MTTIKQEKARARNWSKRAISGAAYCLKSIVCTQHLNIGLTTLEINKLNKISNNLFAIIENWKKTI